MQRLMDEFIDLQDNPEPYITVNVVNHSFYDWAGTLNGPDFTLYEGCIFNFRITFPPNFPASPPEFRFTTPVYHPNIENYGHVCCEIFSSIWNPRIPIRNMLSYVVGLLKEPRLEDPNEFNKFTREWTF